MNDMTVFHTELEELTSEQLGGEIRLLASQARKVVLGYAIEIGHRLVLAKEKVGHGEWIDWVARETTLSQSGANRMMRLYEEYGSRQESLFGAEANSSTLANLSVSNALQLLAFPAEEREQAAAELDAENLSSRDLAEAIAARKAAEAERDEWKEAAVKAREEAAATCEDAKEIAYQKRRAEEAREAADKELQTVTKQLSTAREQIRELEARPVEVAVERDEKAIEEAAAKAKAEAEAAAGEKLAALQKKLEKAEAAVEKEKKRAAEGVGPYKEKLAEAEAEVERAKAELEAMRKQLAASDKDVTEFILHSKTAQASLQAMLDGLAVIAAKEPDKARKLNVGLKTLVERIGARCAEIEAGFGKREETTPHPSAALTPSPQGEGLSEEVRG